MEESIGNQDLPSWRLSGNCDSELPLLRYLNHQMSAHVQTAMPRTIQAGEFAMLAQSTRAGIGILDLPSWRLSDDCGNRELPRNAETVAQQVPVIGVIVNSRSDAEYAMFAATTSENITSFDLRRCLVSQIDEKYKAGFGSARYNAVLADPKSRPRASADTVDLGVVGYL